MLTKDLLNKNIIEIRCLTFKYEYNGSIPLEDVIVELRLDSGEIINYPLHPNAQLEKKANFNPMLNKIYPNNWIKNFVGKKNPFEEIKNQYITDVFMFDDDFGEELCGLVFSNGYLLLKGKMSPIGTGNADLFIFKTIDLARKKYSQKNIESP